MLTRDKMLDYIYDLVDESLLLQDFAFVDSLLAKSSLILKNTDTDIILGLLTISLAAKSKLQCRAYYVWKAREEFINRKLDNIDGLLSDLE